MKLHKKILIIIVVITMFLTSNLIVAYSALTNNIPQSIGFNNENFIEYVNNLYIDKNDVEYIVGKGKRVAEKIQGKFSINEFSVKEILSIYNDMSSIANDLNLKLNLNIKKGTFNLKEKDNKNVIFHGNINELEEYFNFYKNNISTLTKEVLGNIENKETIKNIEEFVREELGTSIKDLSSSINVPNNENKNSLQSTPQEEIDSENNTTNKKENTELYLERENNGSSREKNQGNSETNDDQQEEKISTDKSKENTNIIEDKVNDNLPVNEKKENNISNVIVSNKISILKWIFYMIIISGILSTSIIISLKFKD